MIEVYIHKVWDSIFSLIFMIIEIRKYMKILINMFINEFLNMIYWLLKMLNIELTVIPLCVFSHV